ncbi:unnamed protein product, partial [Polarella glacialis]
RATTRLRKAPAPAPKDAPSGAEGAGQRRQTAEDQATLKVARKLAHLYNEEARAALVHSGPGSNTERAEELLSQAHQWMMLSGDLSNASRVLLNLSELHAIRSEFKNQNSVYCRPDERSRRHLLRFITGRLFMWWPVIAYEVLLHTFVLEYISLFGFLSSGRDETIVDLADRHLQMLWSCLHYNQLKDEREIAVCHFHMADLALQEERIPGAPPMPKVRLTLALRHARKSADYWERSGALQYTKDFVASHIRVARLLESQQRSSAFFEATEHLAEVEATLVALANRQSPGSRTSNGDEGMFTLQGSKAIAVPPLRREMSRVCQAGIRQGEDVDRLKVLYGRVLRNEPIRPVQDSVPSPG